MTTEGTRAFAPDDPAKPAPERAGALALLDVLWDAPVGIALLDRDLRVVRVNDAMARITGHPVQAHAGTPASELPPLLSRRREVRTALDGRASDGVLVSAEWPPGSHETSSWLTSYRPVRVGTDVVGVCAVFVDVTARRRAERAAQEARSEAELAVQALMRLQAITASLAAALTPAEVARVVIEEGLGLLDATAGSLSWTAGVDELEVLDAFGYPEHSLVSRRRFAVDLPAPLSEAFRTGEAVWLESPEDYEARYRHLAASARPFRGASVAVPLAGRGRVVGVLGIDFEAARSFEPADRSFILALADQAAQALERARLYDEQERLRSRAERTAALLDTLLSSVPIGLAFVDWDLRFVHANCAWARLHEGAPREHVGQTVAEVLGGEGGQERARELRRVLETGEPVIDVEVNATSEDGAGARTWLESWYPVVAGGDTIGLGLVARDVSEARRAEEFRSNVLGIVGHDLRNPLNAIEGFAKLLATRGGLDETGTHMAERIQASAGKAARIVRDLLDLTRIQSARGIPIEPRPARVEEICAAVAEEAESASPGREIRCAACGTGDVRWDPDRVSQALSNLVVNALKYGAPGSVVTIGCEASEGDVAISVHNWGPPIPAAVRAHLFAPFRQGAQAGARAGGLGLGLYISREIARAHGGSLDARSSEGEGTTFTLRLPREARP